MGTLTVSELFVFIILIIIVLHILICWKVYRYEKNRPGPPPVNFSPVLDKIEGLSQQIGSSVSKAEAVAGLSSQLTALQNSAAALSEKIAENSNKTQRIEDFQVTLETFRTVLEAISTAIGMIDDHQKEQRDQLTALSDAVQKITEQKKEPGAPTESKKNMSSPPPEPASSEPKQTDKPADCVPEKNPQQDTPAENKGKQAEPTGNPKADPANLSGQEADSQEKTVPRPASAEPAPSQSVPDSQAENKPEVGYKSPPSAENETEKKKKDLLARI